MEGAPPGANQKGTEGARQGPRAAGKGGSFRTTGAGREGSRQTAAGREGNFHRQGMASSHQVQQRASREAGEQKAQAKGPDAEDAAQEVRRDEQDASPVEQKEQI